jgi:hypothetical protein
LPKRPGNEPLIDLVTDNQILTGNIINKSVGFGSSFDLL